MTENYAAAFGAQWLRWRTTQLDSVMGVPVARDRLRRCVGESIWNRLSTLSVLEIGCGAGRFTEVLLAEGASVTSVDLSDAVYANVANFPQSPKHRVVRADALRLPFPPRQFDLVLCLGVLQHTPSPERTIEALAAQVAPDGWLVIDHYTYSLSWALKPAWIVRQFLKRARPDAGIKWSERLVRWFWPLHRWARDSRWRRVLVNRISPLIIPSIMPSAANEATVREYVALETHDALMDHYKRRRTRGQIRRALERSGLSEIWSSYGGNGVEARGHLERVDDDDALGSGGLRHAAAAHR
jgi:SAM-dependent methyltransferase